MLFADFSTNYNDLPQLHRKGTTIVWDSNGEGQVRVWWGSVDGRRRCLVRVERVLGVVRLYSLTMMCIDVFLYLHMYAHMCTG